MPEDEIGTRRERRARHHRLIIGDGARDEVEAPVQRHDYGVRSLARGRDVLDQSLEIVATGCVMMCGGIPA